MPFKRQLEVGQPPSHDALTAAMAGIGMEFATTPRWDADIEETILWAAREALEADDLRVFSMLVAWLDVHASVLNADRLFRLAKMERSERVRGFFAALATWKRTDPRFRRFSGLYRGARLDLLRSGTDFQLSRGGEDSRFKGSSLRVSARSVRAREGDVLPLHALVSKRRDVYWRVLIGPSYQADMWAALEANPKLSASELARLGHGSFSTAWHVKQRWRVLSEARRAPGAARRQRGAVVPAPHS